MSLSKKVLGILESCLLEYSNKPGSPAAVARRKVLSKFNGDTVVLQAPGGGVSGYSNSFMMIFLPVNKSVSWSSYVTSLNSYLVSQKITDVVASTSQNGMHVVSKRDSVIFYDKKLMDIIDRWITDKTNWRVVDMYGFDASKNQVLEQL